MVPPQIGSPSPALAVAPRSRGLHIGLWVVQVLLALAFVATGLNKVLTPAEQLASQMAWAKEMSPVLIKFIGLAEVLGVLGLILPSATRIKPVLTPLAAGGLVIVMMLAAITHVRLGDPAPMVVANIILGGLAAFVAWGRLKPAPIAPRA